MNKEEKMDLLNQTTSDDLVKFGIIPELVGRVPINVTLESLDREALIRILTEPKNSITKQYQKLLELDGVELAFDREALEQIADTSLARKTGARGLRAIMENVMMDVMYEIPSDETIEREFSPLLKIPDKYDAYVLSMDEFNMSRDGIKHMNILDFLLGDEI